ncbi:hypothetical protein GCM10009550_09980 [Actinocorallia libanotica]|uniref:Uncharacterized protein n=1 Tax=Actinocorallia libanotica TaxID=46162 RepID=A0ABP4AS55_9ACTN
MTPTHPPTPNGAPPAPPHTGHSPEEHPPNEAPFATGRVSCDAPFTAGRVSHDAPLTAGRVSRDAWLTAGRERLRAGRSTVERATDGVGHELPPIERSTVECVSGGARTAAEHALARAGRAVEERVSGSVPFAAGRLARDAWLTAGRERLRAGLFVEERAPGGALFAAEGALRRTGRSGGERAPEGVLSAAGRTTEYMYAYGGR